MFSQITIMRLLFLVFLTTSAIFLSEKPDIETNTGLVLRPSHRYCRSQSFWYWKFVRFLRIFFKKTLKTIKVHSSNSQALPVLLIRTYLKGNYFRGRGKSRKNKLRKNEKLKLADNLLNLLWINYQKQSSGLNKHLIGSKLKLMWNWFVYVMYCKFYVNFMWKQFTLKSPVTD